MSAWICTPYHINALVTWAMHRAVTYDYKGGTTRVSPASANILYAENVRSVNHRYGDDTGDNHMFEGEPSALELAPVVIIKSCGCLDYQSCETDDYDTTEAKAINEAIKLAALRLALGVHGLVAARLMDEKIGKLPGYDEAPWGLNPPEKVAQ